jgi:hypothetical protein
MPRSLFCFLFVPFVSPYLKNLQFSSGFQNKWQGHYIARSCTNVVLFPILSNKNIKYLTTCKVELFLSLKFYPEIVFGNSPFKIAPFIKVVLQAVKQQIS